MIAEALERVIQNVQQLQSAGVSVSAAPGLSGILSGAAVGDISPRQTKLVQEFRAVVKLLTTDAAALQKAAQQAAINQKNVTQFTKDIGKNQKELAELEGKQLSPQARLNKALEDGAKDLANFNTAIKNLTILLDTPRNKEILKAAAEEEEARRTQNRFRGGFIRRQQGGFVPKGTDTVPAMLTPGEFVMNATASRKFAAQLVSMNSNIQPQRFQQGGPVNNNNKVTVNLRMDGATESPDQMAVKVAQAINRQQRRGTAPSLN